MKLCPHCSTRMYVDQVVVGGAVAGQWLCRECGESSPLDAAHVQRPEPEVNVERTPDRTSP